MSGWTAYIDNLHACTAIKRSAIVGYPSGEVWARSEGANAFAVSVKHGFIGLNFLEKVCQE